MILVTGCNGQLGMELQQILKSDEAIFADRKIADIENYDQVEKLILEKNVNSIINCAAYTNVDLAEKEVDKAFGVNEKGALNMALLAKKYNLTLIHISTDYVFDGSGNVPLKEDDPTYPISVYGKSKLAGEKRILEVNPNGAIIRTSWLYSRFGKNFYNTMVKLGNERNDLNVVFDQVGTPTCASELAKSIILILPKIKSESCEIYHYSNEGIASWFDFAVAIMKKNKSQCLVFPIESKDYVTPARRPVFSVLKKDKIKNKLGVSILHWQLAMDKYL
jgi:dTDP-4-dehydrorhamnose reductase